MSSEARPIQLSDVEPTEENLRKFRYQELEERRKRHEEEYKIIDKKCEYWVKYWHEEAIKAKCDNLRLEEQKEKKQYYEKFKPVRERP